MTPEQQMRSLGITQEGDPVLTQVTRPFDPAAEAGDARRILDRLNATLDRVAEVHYFSKGMGIAAPQIGINRAAAVIRTAGGHTITLLNPRIVELSEQTDEQYEGCLSFFGVRGLVPRPLHVVVEHLTIDGHVEATVFERGVARLVCHEVDHLLGVLYRSRMRAGVDPVPASEAPGSGQPWCY